VQIGMITYDLRDLPDPATKIIPTMLQLGLSEVELMSSHAERLAGAPFVDDGFGGFPGSHNGATMQLNSDGLLASCANLPMFVTKITDGLPDHGRAYLTVTPEKKAALAKLAAWRPTATPATWHGVRKQFTDAGIDLRILCYNMGASTTDDDIDYAFRMARDLGVKAISSSSTVSVAKRVAPFADRYKITWAGHGHDDLNDPEQFARPETYRKIMSFSDYIGINLDIGHFTAAGFDAVPFIKENHARITNIHLKDRKKSTSLGGGMTNVFLNNFPWGQGESPIKDVLLLLKKEKYDIPANIEYEYGCRASGDTVTELAKCLAYARNCLEG